MQQHTVHEAASSLGYALEVDIQRKLAVYLPACRAAGVIFIPMVAETLGGLAKDIITIVWALSKAITQQISPLDSSSTSQHLFYQLAIALWKGSACLWLHWQPPLPPSIDDVI